MLEPKNVYNFLYRGYKHLRHLTSTTYKSTHTDPVLPGDQRPSPLSSRSEQRTGTLCDHVCYPTPRTVALSTLCAGVEERLTPLLAEDDIIGLEIPPSHIFPAGETAAEKIHNGDVQSHVLVNKNTVVYNTTPWEHAQDQAVTEAYEILPAAEDPMTVTQAVIFDEIDLTDLSFAECSIKNVNHSFQGLLGSAFCGDWRGLPTNQRFFPSRHRVSNRGKP
uniref:Uncharacterized protein n=1 Tax=Timema monikensis TaxID=170555 RepID=A0A7R9HNJ9_9NEOP|nr:unnamed protein product [Timema monikensis]